MSSSSPSLRFGSTLPATTCPPSITLLNWLLHQHDQNPSMLNTCTDDSRNPISNNILLLDGGVSTYLEQQGHTFQHRELWSSSLLLTEEGCRAIEDCHQVFAAAGADILSSVTYQCHYGTSSHDCSCSSSQITGENRQRTSVLESKTTVVDDNTMSAMINEGLRLSKANTRAYAVASLGCYGAALADGSEYRGDYAGVTREMLFTFHNRKLQTVLMDKIPPSSSSSLPVDAVALETVPNLEEVTVLVEVLKQASLAGIATWISMACRNGHQLNDGTEVEIVLDELCRLDPDGTIVHAIGFNCCHGQHTSSLLGILARHMGTTAKDGRRCHAKRGIVVYPNSGEDWDAATASWKEGTGCTIPQEFAHEMKEGIEVVERIWKELRGSKESMPKMIVGGCCRTSPATIAALRAMIDKRERALIVR